MVLSLLVVVVVVLSIDVWKYCGNRKDLFRPLRGKPTTYVRITPREKRRQKKITHTHTPSARFGHQYVQ